MSPDSVLSTVDDDFGWAVWVGEPKNNRCIAVVADSEEEARSRALEQAENYDSVYNVDGPMQGAEPGVWEFEFVTEHRERVVVEAPTESYAEETADAERDHRGEYMDTIHTTTRKLKTKRGDDGE